MFGLVFWVSELVFWVSGLVFLVSGTVLGMSILVFLVSTHHPVVYDPAAGVLFLLENHVPGIFEHVYLQFSQFSICSSI